MNMTKLIERLLEKLLSKPLDKLARKVEKWEREADAARNAEQAQEGAQEAAESRGEDKGGNDGAEARGVALSAFPLGLASCWDGANASRRMMNILSPKMDEAKFKQYVSWMKSKGCDTAHVILANGGDGECSGFAAWRDKDYGAMLSRYNALLREGFRVVPWIITDDSAALLKELFKDPAKCVEHCRAFFRDAAYVVLGLEMDEGGSAGQWAAVRDAVRRYYSGPIGVHHTSGNSFPMAPMADIILGQLNPGCTESQVAAQIKAIKAKGKRAVGFEYARGPSRKLALAALNAGAEGCGNWDGGAVPGAATVKENATVQPLAAQAQIAEDSVDFSLLDWRYGGFKGGGAALDSKARIMGLRVTASGLSYSWMSGGCENLGASSKEDAACLACLFCLVGGKWRGGKFDWISTSRTTRDFKNIAEAYNGWDKGEVGNADKFAFVICSRDGKRRTNVILCAK
jgi:hypothetical protein